MLGLTKATLALFLSVSAIIVVDVDGHGRLMDPPNRSSLWRFTDNPLIAPHARKIKQNNRDDNLNCGGIGGLLANDGKCGVCGDRFDGVKENEAGGKYSRGIISKRYVRGQIINVTVEMTIGHPGFFEFRLCRWNKPNRPVKQRCLNRNLLRQPNGDTKFNLPPFRSGFFQVSLQLPQRITCKQCVLQWKHKDGEGKIVRQYTNCADIAIEDDVTSSTQSTTTTTTTRRPRTTNTRRPRTRTTRRPRTRTTRQPRTTTTTTQPKTRKQPKCRRQDLKLKCLDCGRSYLCTGPNRPVVVRCRRGTVCDSRRGSCQTKSKVPTC